MKTDKQLFKSIKKGSHNAFSELVNRHTDKSFRLAYKILGNATDAEDITQNIFIRVWQNPNLWDVNKSQFSTWLYQVVLNACRDYIRKQKKTTHHDIENLSVSTLEDSTLNELTQEEYSNQQHAALKFALSQLTEKQRDAIHLVIFCELPQKKVAKMMNINLKALESLLSRAKQTLKKTIKPCLSYE